MSRKTASTSRITEIAVVLGSMLLIIGLLNHHLQAAGPRPELELIEAFPGAQIAEGPAPDFALERADGSIVTLEDLRGKVIFLNFWATWCPPCREEMPDMEKLARDLQFDQFEMVAVSSDESWKEIDDYALGFEDKLGGMTVLLDTQKALAAKYGTEKFPETYIIDPQGRLRMRFVNKQPWTRPEIATYLNWLANGG
ncbi:MAG: redoxin domain-containing protein [Bradymonadia bacterium]